MGFKLPVKEIQLVLADEMADAEIVCKASVPISTFLLFQNVEDRIEAAYRSFGDTVLLRWDLEDENGPIPATGEGMLRLPPEIGAMIVGGWSDTVANPQQGSEAASKNGSTSGEQPTLKAVR
jgi:hypothetical protein